MNPDIAYTRKMIKSKFITIPRFARVAKLPVEKVRFALYRDIPSTALYRQMILELLENMSDRPEGNGGDFHPEEAEKIRIAIYTHYRNAADFYTQHPEFEPAFISRVINGTAKTKTERIKQLANVLNVEL
jgi:hypothetical protein